MLSLTAKSGLIRVGDVQEAVGVLALLVHLAHQCVTLQNIPAIHKEVQRVFLGESNSLSDDEAKLIGGEVAGSQVSKMEKKRVMSDELAKKRKILQMDGLTSLGFYELTCFARCLAGWTGLPSRR